jgi:Bacterial lectin
MKVPSLFPRAFSVFFGFFCLLVLAAPHAYAQNSFTDPPFTGLQLNGSAGVTEGGILQLTPASADQAGSAWYINPAGPGRTLSLSNGFSTTFQFQFANPGGITGTNGLPGADGIAFMVQNSGANALGSDGGNIGITGITNSVAVQFDTWCNTEFGDTCATKDTFSSADQITVESCGAAANTVNHNASPTCSFGTIDLSTIATPIYLADGKVHTAQISYAPPAVAGSCTPSSHLGSDGCGSITVILDGQTVLTVPFNLSYLGLDSTDDAYVGFTGATGGSWETQSVLSWNFMADVTSTVSQPVSTPPPNGQVNLPAVFSSTTGQTLNTDITYVTTNNLSTQDGVTNPVIITTNTTVPPGNASGSWPQYVVGTPWAPSQCTIKAANGPSGLCSLYTNACFQSGTSSTTASDANCPTIAEPSDTNYILLQDTFDWVGKWTPTPGMTASLIAFTVPSTDPSLQWIGSTNTTNPVCATQTTSTAPPCYLSDSLIDMFGDQTTTRGSKPKSKAWIVSAVNVPMLTTSITLTPPSNNSSLPCSPMLNNPPMDNPNYASTVWNNGACIMDFMVEPAQPPSSNTNFFQAAEPAFLEYGFLQGTPTPPAPPLAPGPLPPGDQTITNPNPVLTCGSTSCSATEWDTGLNTSLTSVFGGDGTFTLHWSAKDTAGITEKNITLSTAVNGSCPTPNGPVSGSQCYTTNYFTTQVNIDSVKPTGSCPAGPTTWQPNNVTLACTESDDRSGIDTSNGPTITPLPVSGTAPVSFDLSTSVPGGTETSMADTGSQQFCDFAMNCAVVGPFGPYKVDMKAPVITVSVPTVGQQIPAYASVSSSILCTDGGSGVASCNGTAEPGVPSANVGAPLDTKPNGPGLTPKTLTVGANNNTFDAVDNISSPVMVNYNVSCHFASVILNSPTLKKGISFAPAATMLTDCVSTTQKVVITFSLTGPFGKSCSTSTQLLFIPIPVTIPANTNKSPIPGVILFVPENACSGSGFTFSTNTYSTKGALLDSVSELVTVQ